MAVANIVVSITFLGLYIWVSMLNVDLCSGQHGLSLADPPGPTDFYCVRPEGWMGIVIPHVQSILLATLVMKSEDSNEHCVMAHLDYCH